MSMREFALSVTSHQVHRATSCEMTEESMEASSAAKQAAGRMHLDSDAVGQNTSIRDSEPINVETIRTDMQDCKQQDPELHVNDPTGKSVSQQQQPTKVADNLMHDGGNFYQADSQAQQLTPFTEAQVQDTSFKLVQEPVRYADPQQSTSVPSASEAELSRLKQENEELRVEEMRNRSLWQDGVTTGLLPGISMGTIIGFSLMLLL